MLISNNKDWEAWPTLCNNYR